MPFCRVCKDAGKTMSQYTSHFVKDRPGGFVVCPTLLEQQCKYCHDKGHTPKYCPKLKRKNSFNQPTSSSTHSTPHTMPLELQRYHADGFVCHDACSHDTPSPPPYVYEEYPPLRVLNEKYTRPTRVGAKIPTCWNNSLVLQTNIEEDLSLWAGMATAYTMEEESFAQNEMDLEAEFLDDMDAFEHYSFKYDYSRFDRPMQTLEDCTWG